MSIIAFYCRVFTEYSFAQCAEKFMIQSFIYNFSSAYAPLPFHFLGGKRRGQILSPMDRWTGRKQHVSHRKGDVSVNLVIVVTNQTHFDA